MKLRRHIKKNARRALAGFWAGAVAITLLLIGFYLLLAILETLLMNLWDIPAYLDVAGTPDNPFDDVPNTSPLAFGILLVGWGFSLLLGTPMAYGAARWFYWRGGAQPVTFGDVFFYFASPGQYLKCLFMQLNLSVRRCFYGALFLLPGASCIAAGKVALRAVPAGSDSVLAAGLTLSGYVVFACGTLLFLIFRQRYTLARYLFFAQSGIGVGEAIRLSIVGSRGIRLSMALFLPSFAPWILLCAVGIPALYIYPYIQMARGIYARVLITGKQLPEHLDAMRDAYEQQRRTYRGDEAQHLRKDSPV